MGFEPGDEFLLPPSLGRSHPAKLSASIGAPGPHDFAVRDQLRSSSQAVTSTASHRAFVTCATPLLSGETGRGDSADLPDGLSGIFLRSGLDRFSLICPSGCFVAATCAKCFHIEERARNVNHKLRGFWELIVAVEY